MTLHAGEPIWAANVGQGYKDFSPANANVTAALLKEKGTRMNTDTTRPDLVDQSDPGNALALSGSAAPSCSYVHEQISETSISMLVGFKKWIIECVYRKRLRIEKY